MTTEFFAKGALNPTPTDVQVLILGKGGSGKTLVAGVIKDALEALPSTTVCLDPDMRRIAESMSPNYFSTERARLKEHPLFVGLSEARTDEPVPAGEPQRGPSLETQVEALANFILERCPDQIIDQGACGTAQAIINDLLIARDIVTAGIDSTGLLIGALQERIEALREYVVKYHPEADLEEGLFAAVETLLTAQRGELRQIDNLLSGRPALDDCDSRYTRIAKALARAGQADTAERQRDNLAGQLAKAEEQIRNREFQIELLTEQRDQARAERVKVEAELTHVTRTDPVALTAEKMVTVDMRQGAQPLPEPYATAGGLDQVQAGNNPAEPAVTLDVYIDDGNVYYYDVPTVSKAREHADAILKTGYRHVANGDLTTLEWFPPHRIAKVKIKAPAGVATDYTDSTRGT